MRRGRGMSCVETWIWKSCIPKGKEGWERTKWTLVTWVEEKEQLLQDTLGRIHQIDITKMVAFPHTQRSVIVRDPQLKQLWESSGVHWRNFKIGGGGGGDLGIAIQNERKTVSSCLQHPIPSQHGSMPPGNSPLERGPVDGKERAGTWPAFREGGQAGTRQEGHF